MNLWKKKREIESQHAAEIERLTTELNEAGKLFMLQVEAMIQISREAAKPPIAAYEQWRNLAAQWMELAEKYDLPEKNDVKRALSKSRKTINEFLTATGQPPLSEDSPFWPEELEP